MPQSKHHIRTSGADANLRLQLKQQDLEHLHSEPGFSFTRRGQRDYLFLGLLCLLAVLLRYDFLQAVQAVPDADEAIVGLMAQDILEGKPIPTFYYGQHYMGSLEAILTAGAFYLFGSSNWTLKLIPLFFSVLLIPLTYSLGRELGGKFTARVAALFMAIPPAALVIWSGKTRGGFIELVFIGSLALLIVFKSLRERILLKRRSVYLGLILGFGWWVNNQIIFYVAPVTLGVAALVLLTAPRSFAQRLLTAGIHLTLGLVGFFCGGFPFWKYNLEHEFVSFKMFNSAGSKAVLDHFEGLLNTSIPILLGAKHFWETEDIFPYSSLCYLAFYGTLLLIYLLSSRQVLADVFRLRISSSSGQLLPLVFILSTFAIFVLSSFGHLYQAPRYLLPAYTGLFLIFALAIRALHSVSAPFAYLALLLSLLANLASSYVGGRATPGEPIVFANERVARDQQELINWLKEKSFTRIRTNYWIGYRLSFETKEEITFAVFQDPKQVRIEKYEAGLSEVKLERLPLLLTPRQGSIVEAGLSAQGIKFTKTTLSGYTLLYDFQIPDKDLRPVEQGLSVKASDSSDSAALAVDGNLKTRWGTGRPQSPDMSYTLSLDTARKLRAIEISWENFESDFGRNLRLDATLPDGSSINLLSENSYGFLLYTIDHKPSFTLYLEPQLIKELTLRQTGKDSYFDWSLAEIRLYE